MLSQKRLKSPTCQLSRCSQRPTKNMCGWSTHNTPSGLSLAVMLPGFLFLNDSRTAPLCMSRSLVWSSAVAAGGTFAALSAVTLAREGGEKGGGGGAHSDARSSGTIAAACLFGAAAAGVGGWAMGAGGPSVVVSSLGVAGFCALVVHDTASIVHRYGVDDSINAALQLYLDALNLFVCVLQLCEAAGAD